MTELESFFEYINEKKVALLGLGISNTPLIDLLLAHGAYVSAHDKKERAGFDGEFIKRLEDNGVRLCLGDKYLDELDEDIIIKAPGIRRDIPALLRAEERGAVITSECELFFRLSECEKYAITGSDGKTTTTTLTYLMLKEHFSDSKRNVYVGGNIGKPLFALCDSIGKDDIAVMELSSFQLHAMKVRPNYAAITNVSPNHLDWHTGYDEYIDSKKRIFEYMDGGHVVLNYDNDITRSMVSDLPSTCNVRFFTLNDPVTIPEEYTVVYKKDGGIFVRDALEKKTVHLMNASDILIPGEHNVQNYMTAAALLYGRVDNRVFKNVAVSFGGVEHRCELVREKNGVKYYNSSIDSSPTRSMAALRSFGDKKVIAIMGGYDKHIPYDVMGDCVCEHTKAVILTGATAPKIREAIEGSAVYEKTSPDIHSVDDFVDAVKLAHDIAREGDTVILTPASASFDRFKNFEERGNLFKEIVRGF